MKSGDLNKYDLVKNTLVLVLAGGRGSRFILVAIVALSILHFLIVLTQV